MRATQLTALVGAVVLTACRTSDRVTNPDAPGPAVGNAIGAGAGAVAGNVAGAVVGIGEGAADAASRPFKHDPTQRIVRHWREEKTADGRTVRVAEYYLVDAQGRVIRRVDENGK